MKIKKAYCHTSFDNYKEGIWYDIFHDTKELIIINCVHARTRTYYKNSDIIKGGPLFSNYFCTPEEYRDRRLNILLNVENKSILP